MDSREQLKRLLVDSAIPLDSLVAEQLAEYLALLEKWNSRINLTSSTEWDVIGPMIREGIWASRLYPETAVSHLDVGSGAGFPAVLFSILIPRIELEMVESRERKSQFLETAAYALGLKAVRVHQSRLADFLQSCEPGKTWDCISWKALRLKSAELAALHAHTHPDTQLWMFHGREAALEESTSIEKGFRMVRKEKVPAMKDWHLSVFRPS